MTEYRFRLILSGPFSDKLTNNELLDATDVLGTAGCDDALISVHADGLEVEFDRSHHSLEKAIVSAVQDVERAGFHVESIEMDREALVPVDS
ncbi:hypothetical protein [Candidatus Entotheonella palauensis]|uniref:HMA domain-containing protein n=1 Tax=Candidatus Entotheonella gemina TaxID=1429439 RepID=W4M2K2_9BACT|nr:hypothetical protein [Candidatus Entotheonella palauensis]ETX04191.1 MAG: hypothetical protein ETSY2_30150 [Candidatus Entotheonella gemina]